MKEIKAEYIKNIQCKAYHDVSKSVVITDASKDATSIGFTPPELFAISLVTCMATMMGYEAEALKLDLLGMKMTVTLEMSHDKPRRVEKLHTEFWIPCYTTENQKELLVRIAKSCPISHSIHANIEQSMKFHWQEKE